MVFKSFIYRGDYRHSAMKIRTHLIVLLLMLASAMANIATGQTHEGSDPDRPTFVLVHGTFQWEGQWNPLSSLLRKEGYIVLSPSMTGLGEREHLLSKQTGLSPHIDDIANYITWLGLQNVILVSHSYGGAVFTRVADKTGDRVSHVVYVDTWR